jgi:hypothetical protein
VPPRKKIKRKEGREKEGKKGRREEGEETGGRWERRKKEKL